MYFLYKSGKTLKEISVIFDVGYVSVYKCLLKNEECKALLPDRWNDFNGIKVQRDIYSAFLIMNVNSDLKTIDNNKCNETFENFYRLHNKEVDRLKGNKNLSSIAI